MVNILKNQFQNWLKNNQYNDGEQNILRCVIAELEDAAEREHQSRTLEDYKEEVFEILDIVHEDATYDDCWDFCRISLRNVKRNKKRFCGRKINMSYKIGNNIPVIPEIQSFHL